MSELNWMRKYILEVGPQGGKGFKIGNTDGTDTQEVLRISFSVDKSDTAGSNTAEIKIWNLSPDSLKILDEKDCVAILRAGYGNTLPEVIVGLITNVSTENDNADRCTTLEVVDGRMELRDTYISQSWDGKINTKNLYQWVADAMGITLVLADDLQFEDFANGYKFVGKAKEMIQELADANEHAWSIQNGVLQVYYKGRPVSDKAYLLKSETGLLGIPKKITVSENNDTNANLTGYEINYFFNGAIGVNDIVQIESNTASGYYRIYKLNQKGDNFESDWICTAEVLEIKSLPTRAERIKQRQRANELLDKISGKKVNPS